LSERHDFLELLDRIRHARRRAPGWVNRIYVRRDIHGMLAANYQTQTRVWSGMCEGCPCLIDDNLRDDEFRLEWDSENSDDGN
jgi:hypothetical protein